MKAQPISKSETKATSYNSRIDNNNKTIVFRDGRLSSVFAVSVRSKKSMSQHDVDYDDTGCNIYNARWNECTVFFQTKDVLDTIVSASIASNQISFDRDRYNGSRWWFDLVLQDCETSHCYEEWFENRSDLYGTWRGMCKVTW